MVNDESRYGNNCDIFIQQSQEERQAKSGRHYIGNASVIWTDGNITKGQREDNNSAPLKPPFPVADKKPADDIDDLPF